MATPIITTTDYTGRQIDVELLQTVIKPVEVLQVSLSTIVTPAKMVTGIQKLVQRYALLLLTNIGDVNFAQDQGGDLLRMVLGGYVQDLGQLQFAFASANTAVVRMLSDDDLNADAFGAAPDDERISSAMLLDSTVDKATSTAFLRIQIVSQAGSDFTFVLPVTRQ